MKKHKISRILVILFCSGVSVGCRHAATIEDWNANDYFDVQAVYDKTQKQGDTLDIKKNSVLYFRLRGNPDSIRFFSGEPGHEFANRGGLDKAIHTNLILGLQTRYGSNTGVKGSFKFFLSTSFPGLGNLDKKNDSIEIIKAQWIDLTQKCSVPQIPNKLVAINLLLDEFAGKTITLAFHYHTIENMDTQPLWYVKKMHLVEKLPVEGKQTRIPAASMGLSAIDLLASPQNAYKTASHEYVEGMWNLLHIADKKNDQVNIYSSAKGHPLNDDWLISRPIPIKELAAESILIKSEVNPLYSYQYRFSKTGIFKVTFLALEEAHETIKQFNLKVME